MLVGSPCGVRSPPIGTFSFEQLARPITAAAVIVMITFEKSFLSIKNKIKKNNK